MYSYGPPHMAKQKQDDQPELTYSRYVRTQDVTLKTCQRRWMRGRSGERWSGISVLAARHDDDDDDNGDKNPHCTVSILQDSLLHIIQTETFTLRVLLLYSVVFWQKHYTKKYQDWLHNVFQISFGMLSFLLTSHLSWVCWSSVEYCTRM